MEYCERTELYRSDRGTYIHILSYGTVFLALLIGLEPSFEDRPQGTKPLKGSVAGDRPDTDGILMKPRAELNLPGGTVNAVKLCISGCD